ncbi:MAG: hypothetical protein ACI4TG_10305, partial [Ruminococcus sp.]
SKYRRCSCSAKRILHQLVRLRKKAVNKKDLSRNRTSLTTCFSTTHFPKSQHSLALNAGNTSAPTMLALQQLSAQPLRRELPN